MSPGDMGADPRRDGEDWEDAYRRMEPPCNGNSTSRWMMATRQAGALKGGTVGGDDAADWRVDRPTDQ